jgi:hypothetical protein
MKMKTAASIETLKGTKYEVTPEIIEESLQFLKKTFPGDRWTADDATKFAADLGLHYLNAEKRDTR